MSELSKAICSSIQENKDKIEKLSKQNERLKKKNKQLKEKIDKLDNYIEQIRKMLYKRHLDDYDLYTANVLCDMQSEFEEILRGEY